MFKQKDKQIKKDSKINARLLGSIEDYHNKIKQTHHQIYLNCGIDTYENNDKFTYQTTVNISHFQDLLNEAVKGFSSFYKMDNKTYQWIDKVQNLIKTTKDIVKTIDKFKRQIKKINEILNQNGQLRQNNTDLNKQINYMKEELQKVNAQLQSIKNNQNIQEFKVFKQQGHTLKQQKQANKQFDQNQQQQKSHLKDQLESIIKQNSLLKNQINQLKENIKSTQNQNTQLKNHLKKIYQSSFSPKTIQQVLYQSKNINFQIKDISQNTNNQKGNLKNIKISFQKNVLLNENLSKIIVSFLPPKSINSILSLSKTSRFFLLHNPQIIQATFRSINGFKNFEISFFHRHIEHFQKLLKRIPQEIIQSTFYQFNILKQQIGGDFSSILNLCGNIFEGKINSNNSQNNKVLRQYLESKEIVHHLVCENQEERFLRVEKQLVQQFFQERKGRKQLIMKEIQLMSSKISFTESIYSVDEASSREFYQNIIKLFTILFVLGKELFSQARNVQYLNNFLLGQLNEITRFRIEKQCNLEDVQAELQSSTKMNLFLSEKCNKSEERILRQSKQLVQNQQVITKLKDSLKQQHNQNLKCQSELKNLRTQNQKIVGKFNQARNLYNSAKDKYNRLLNQLNNVKTSILKIN